MAAALLSSNTPGAKCNASSNSEPTLPDCSAILPAFKISLHSDPFWGPGHYSTILSRAQGLTAGIQDLIAQCEILESRVSSTLPSPALGGQDLRRGHTIDAIMPDSEQRNREIKLKKGRMARRQARLRDEGQQMLIRMAWQCWSAVNMPADQRLALKAASRNLKGEVVGRRRTLTCP